MGRLEASNFQSKKQLTTNLSIVEELWQKELSAIKNPHFTQEIFQLTIDQFFLVSDRFNWRSKVDMVLINRSFWNVFQ